MLFAVCCVAVSPMRAEPSHRSEMVSQLLFGEYCVVVEHTRDYWIKIRCKYDGYEGWCQESHITSISDHQYEEKVKRITQEWVSVVDYNGFPVHVPLGSWLTGIKDGCISWGDQAVYFAGNGWDISTAVKDGHFLRKLALQFLNTPYLWGGKSVFGADCSGFTQTVFRFFDIFLLRDAWQQATQGETVGFLQEARCGDLAFFDNEQGKITHVGILLNEGEIIHASGKVRVDRIDSVGIMNADNLQRTHKLRIIKRYF